MELTKQWRAGSARSGSAHTRNSRRRLRAAVAAGAMVAVAMPVLSSDAAVGGRRSIEVTTGSDLVILSGYPSRAQVKIVVLRNGTVVGFATKRTNRAGDIELNHSGRAAGDCFESPKTPNIRPGDTIRTRILGTSVRDTSIVRGLFIDNVVRGDTSVTVSGHVQLAGRTGVPSGPLELRVRTDSADLRQNVRADVSDTGTWSREIPVAAGEAAGAEVVLEWIGGGGGELTVAEAPAPSQRLPGCPPIEAN
jgi:hypothetical protein